MTLSNLNNLVKTGQLKLEPFNQAEFDGSLHSGKARLHDANNKNLASESRFDFAYNAAHSLASAALRRQGYHSANRYLVFQALPYTLGVSQTVWRVLAKCHEHRDVAEYGGHLEIDSQFLEDLIAAAQTFLDHINK